MARSIGLVFGFLAAFVNSVCSASIDNAFSARAVNSTQAHPYRFNSVAVTGGGFITGFVAHPAEPNLIYTRTDIGSTYRWNNVTQQWIPLTDFISAANNNTFGTESVALDPTNTQMLYLAQGQYLTSNNSAFFVSEDQGQTFTVHPAPFPMGSNELGRNNGERLAVNPFNPKELYFGTRTEGLWKSEDQAKTWTNITHYPDAAANGIGIVFVIFDPKHEGTIYVGANIPNGLYYTKDGGSSWNSVPGQPQKWASKVLTYPNASKPASTGPQPMRAILASNGIMYVTYADFPGPYGVSYGVVQKFDTSNFEWTDITPGYNGNAYPAPYTPQKFPYGGFNGISVAHDDPNTVVVTSLDRDPGPGTDSLYLSRDGGKSWKDIAQLSSPSYVEGIWGHPLQEAKLRNGTQVPWLSFNNGPRTGGYGAPSPYVGTAKFGWWMSAVLIDPNDSNHVMYGTGATIWSTDDISRADSNWAPTWYVQAQGIEETANLAMISPTEGAHLFSGFGDINGFRHDDLFTPQPMFGYPTFANLDTLDWAGQNPNVIVKAGTNGVSYTDGCGVGAISTDGGLGWNKFPICAPGASNTSRSGGTILVDASATCVVWSGGDLQRYRNATGPFYTSNNGTSVYGSTWGVPTGLNLGTGNISSDKVQPKTFYAYDTGIFYISTDGGATYKGSDAASIGLPAKVDTGAVPVVNYAVAGEIWLPLVGYGLYHSTNFGKSWKKIGPAGLSIAAGTWVTPNKQLFSIGAPAPGYKNPALFMYGQISKDTAADASIGLYRSDDNAKTWVRINDDAHQYGGPYLLQGDPRVYGRVYQGFFGRGIVYADIDGEGNGTISIRPGTYGI